MSNFAFLLENWKSLSESTIAAEKNIFNAPMYSAILSRKSLEEWVRWVYERHPSLEIPPDDSLSSLLHEGKFRTLIGEDMFIAVNTIRKLGNNAVHSQQKINSTSAFGSVKLLHTFILSLIRPYYKSPLPDFSESTIPKSQSKDKTKEELLSLEKKYLEQQTQLQRAENELESYKKILASYTPPSVSSSVLSEDDTRTLYIDAMLREVNWDPNGENVAEFPVEKCMTKPDGSLGDGFADYVLWGDDGKPLAVVEAKRTTRDATAGREQARLYANGLEAKYGQRPVIFYSNGLETYLWDDYKNQYHPRKVYGFYTKDELQILIQRRASKKILKKETINTTITGRTYQQGAIRSVAEALENNQREALLVMATGTGKTRVAASLVDFLSKANWVKKVLFLADRIPLVLQAKKSFNDCVPHLPSIDLTQEKETDGVRIVFSTYQTMIHQIDGEYDGDNRFFGVGHFDLIIFDEIHRSVYNRYKYIFNYFDGIRVGLTATPRMEADRHTYELFKLTPTNPTYSYELEYAVKDGYLVPPVGISVPLTFQRKGIKYDELSEEEKEQFELLFNDPITDELELDEISTTDLNEWLFNINTVDKIIGYVIENGIKIQGGDKLAKTIIFAKNHNHAKFIEERFNLQYPNLVNFLRVIDYHEESRMALLESFKLSNRDPQIAVSVDMLDTGIDIPEVCNLVFIKPIKSKTKFWQMVGRGTRLCKNLFGYGQDKKEFLIFDFCENLEFFKENPKGIEGNQVKSVTQRLFELRLKLGIALIRSEEEESKKYGNEILTLLNSQVLSLSMDSFMVRQHLKSVEKYQNLEIWMDLQNEEVKEIIEQISPLIMDTISDEYSKRFDVLLTDLQLKETTQDGNPESNIKKIKQIASQLLRKSNIPKIAEKKELLEVIKENSFWENATLPQIEKIRTQIRELTRFIDPEETSIYYTDFEDSFQGEGKIINLTLSINELTSYKRKVEAYLQKNKDHTTITKLRKNLQITAKDISELERMLFEQGDVGTKEEFVQAYGQDPLGKCIRSIIGLESDVAREIIGEIMKGKTLNANQIKFIEEIIHYLGIKGIMDPSLLYEPPFTDISPHGVDDLFDDTTADKIVETLRKINDSAVAA
jgi:type I restriction enzyme, R subunit